MSTHTCRICKNSANNKQYQVKEMMYDLGDEFIYFECDHCKCLQIAEIPTDMSKYYPGSYYSMVPYDGKKFRGIFGKIKKVKYSNLIKPQGIIGKIISLLSGGSDFHILKGLDLKKSTRILDVGCGNGRSFLYPLSEVGYKNIKGCDPYLENPLSYPNGLVIENISIFDIDGTWDIITYHHSFEHIENQEEELKRVHDILDKDGVCIIRIPTASSYAWRHYGVNWVQLDAPRHFYLHSVKSIEILADQVGFKIYKTVYDSGTTQFCGSEDYLLKSSGSGNKRLNKSKYKKMAKKLNLANDGDQAAFFLKK
jgi:SAM-dependent methyltransferase